MKNRELLDILGEIDGELIEDAAPVASTERVARPKKFNFGWIKPVSIAASCVIVLGGIIAAKPVYDLINSSDIDAPETLESQEADGDINESPDDGEQADPPSVNDPPSEGNPPSDEPGDEDFDEGNVEESWQDLPTNNSMDDVFNSLLNGNIPDERFLNFGFKGVECDIDIVGEKIDDITVEFFIFEDTKYEVRAEVNKIIGVDDEIALCLRFVEEEKNAEINGYLDFEKYWFYPSKEYEFDSFAQFKEEFLGGEITWLGWYSSYYERNAEVQSKGYWLGEDTLDLLRQMLNQTDGFAVDLDGGERIKRIKKNCDEWVRFGSRGAIPGLSSGNIVIYSSGFLYFEARIDNDQLFFIGEDTAYELIDVIIRGGELRVNNTAGVPQKKESVNIDVVPTRRFYTIVLHENDRHIDRVLDSLRVDQAAFMEEIMKDYKAEYSGVAGASFEAAKRMSDEILKLPFIVPKDGVEVSAITLYYNNEYNSVIVYYTIGNLRYSFEYDLLPGSFNYFGILTRKGEASLNGVSFDVYGNNTYRVGNILCPGQDDRYIRIAITSDTKINGMPALDMFEIIYLEPSSYEDIAALYEEEPVYDESEETETLVFEG